MIKHEENILALVLDLVPLSKRPPGAQSACAIAGTMLGRFV